MSPAAAPRAAAGTIPCAAVVLVLVLLAASWLAVAAAPSTEEAQASRRLAQVREEIRAITAELGALEGERDAAAAALRESDRAVASAMAALRGTDAQIARQESGLQELQAQRSALATRLQHQRQALAALLRAAHAAGRGQRLKLLLAQDRLDAAARALAYHRIFQRDQVARIQRLLGELAELARLGERISARRQQLAEGRAAQQQGVAALEGERSQRRQLLEQLQRQHADRASRLAALGRDEKALAALLERLRDVFADIPQQLDGDRPLAELKGRLPAPLQGTVRSAFGGTLPDGRRSNGWLLGASAGTEVRAIAHGRVAFADWLRGYGLIAIIDHGDGYMSLYAQNDALLAEAGAWVRPGDVLATVGSSGGQQEAALYFELRRNGRPVDPATWLRRP